MATIKTTEIDAVSDPTTSHAYSGTNYGDGANTKGWDGSFTTYHGGSISGSDTALTHEIYATHTFAAATNIERIVYNLTASAYSGGDYVREQSAEVYVSYQTASGWTDLPGSHLTASGGGGNSDCVTGTVTYSTPITAVLAIKVYAKTYAYATGGESTVIAASYIYEIQAYYTSTTIYRGYSGVV